MPTKDRAKKAEQQRAYRAATGSEYDKKYKKARERALNRLAKEKPKAFRRLFNEERAVEGLGPVQER